MSKTRYVLSGGLAFTEEKDMRKLSQWAEKGWLLESFAFLGYTLRKGEPQALQYAMDIQDLNKADREDYYDIFRAGGWEPVCSSGNTIHIFKAKLGTQPIHSDNDTLYEKYRGGTKPLKSIFIVLALVAITSWIIQYSSKMLAWSGVISNVFMAIGTISVILLVPVLMTYGAFLWRSRRIR